MRDPRTPQRHERRRFLTIYGRKAVLEALQDNTLESRILHLAESNRSGGIIQDIQRLAAARGLEIREHNREQLARISRNGKQDQGVALDVYCAAMQELDAYLDSLGEAPQRLLAMDGVTNPQNVGMIIRSVAAAGMDGLLYADKGNPALGPLVIKASVGTVFRAPLLRCNGVAEACESLLARGFSLYRLEANAKRNLFSGESFDHRAVFVLGGETEGVSQAVKALPGQGLSIPMANGVESLNVAVSAALLAFAAREGQRGDGV